MPTGNVQHPDQSTLAAFLFTGDDVFKRIGDLSGGEEGRVSLTKPHALQRQTSLIPR